MKSPVILVEVVVLDSVRHPVGASDWSVVVGLMAWAVRQWLLA